MKKTINGKVYNTETSQKIAEQRISTTEEIYKTTDNEWFLVVTHYCTGEGEQINIFPMNESEVVDWYSQTSDNIE